MSVIFDPFSGQIIDTGSSGGSAPTIGSPVVGANPNAVLVTDASLNLQDIVLSDGELLIGATGAAPIATTLTGTINQVEITNAPNSITLSLPQDISVDADVDFNSLNVVVPIAQTSGGTGVNTAANGKLLIGNGTGFSLSSLTGTTDQVAITDGSGSITISLPQDIATTSSPQFANIILTPSGSLDITGAGGTLAIGTANADIINIGNSGATVNIQGTSFYQNVTDLQVTDKNITINVGGSAGSGSNAGISIEENAIITGYVDTSADRNSWELKAPAQTGIATISPGASGITLNQDSHDPLTIGTGNGLSLSVQAISLQLATTSLTGALSSTDFNTFNDKEDAIVATTSADYYRGDKTFATFDTAAQAASISQVITNGVTTKSPSEDAVFDALALKLSISDFTDTAVNSKLITGFVSGSGTVAATDSILQAINKLDGNIATKVTTVTADIVPTTWSGLADNTANQVITGLAFANTVSSFETLINIQIDATSDLYTTVKIIGTRKSASDWTTNDCQVEFTGDSITGLSFNITSAGQVRITTGTTVGFSSGVVKFRATTV